MDNNKLYLQLRKKENTKFVQNARLVEWVSDEVDAAGNRKVRRTPTQSIRRVERKTMLFIAGRTYLRVKDLTATPIDEKRGIYQDFFGRKTVHIKQKFPCFDSDDYRLENRYYHWIYLVHNNALFCVSYDDENKWVEITSDVAVIPDKQWQLLCDNGILHRVEAELLQL